MTDTSSHPAPQFPSSGLKIAVLGAPGTGKTKFARELVELLGGWDEWTIIDEYVEWLQDHTDLAYGVFGNLLDDLQVVFKRREWELRHIKGKPNMITVGTVLDSCVHNFVRTESASNRSEIGVTTERLRTIAGTFGLLYTESWDYDYAFLLESNDLMGKGLVDLLSTYRAPVLRFNPEVTDDEKARTAANAIRTLEEDSPPEVEERGVRPGGEAGEGNGDSSESVPDVPEQRGTPDDS